MPKSDISRCWFVTVKGPIDFLLQKWTDYRPPSGEVEQLFVVKHSGKIGDEGSHVHVLLKESKEVQKQSLDTRLEKYFDVKKLVEQSGKTRRYNSKVWDGQTDREGAGSYCFHEEGAEILINVGVTDEDILLMRKANAMVQKVVAINKERAANKLIDKAYKHIQFDVLPEWYEEENMMRFRTKVLAFMLREIKAGRSYHPGDGRLKMFVDEVLVKKTPDEKVDSMARRMAEKFWGPRV